MLLHAHRGHRYPYHFVAAYIPHTPSHAHSRREPNGTRQVAVPYTLLARASYATQPHHRTAPPTGLTLRPYVHAHLDTCTLTGIATKHAFSYSMAKRASTLSPATQTPCIRVSHRFPGTPGSLTRTETTHQPYAHAPQPTTCLHFLSVPRNGRNYRTGHASLGLAAQPPMRSPSLVSPRTKATAYVSHSPRAAHAGRVRSALV